jgi:hypothetical protein
LNIIKPIAANDKTLANESNSLNMSTSQTRLSVNNQNALTTTALSKTIKESNSSSNEIQKRNGSTPTKSKSMNNFQTSKSVSPPMNKSQQKTNTSRENGSRRRNGTKSSHESSLNNNNGLINGHLNNNNENSIDTCFYSINIDSIKDDFDFEKNLALFDKDAFYEQLEGHSRPSASTNGAESLNAYDSIFKQPINSTSMPSNITNSGYNTTTTSSNSYFENADKTERYHPISIANLFGFNSTSSLPSSQIINTQSGNYQSLTHQSTINSVNNTNSQSQSMHHQQQNGLQTNKNYRYDEMILNTGEPFDLQQIQVPECEYIKKKYVTDDGIMIPCIDYALRKRLFEQSYINGYSKERQIESMGRCCAEMCLQLVGGPLRFSPKNNHQKPSVLILANSSEIQGAYVVCAARLLSTRNVRVYLYIHNLMSSILSNNLNASLGEINENNKLFANELKLFNSNESKSNMILNSLDDFKNIHSVDLILNAIDSTPSSTLFTQTWYIKLIKFIDSCKASVLTVDPPAEANKGIQSKWCMVPVLPMDMPSNCGRVYLCDLGFTNNIFKSVNIKYQSPFGSKFLIPLHND